MASIARLTSSWASWLFWDILRDELSDFGKEVEEIDSLFTVGLTGSISTGGSRTGWSWPRELLWFESLTPWFPRFKLLLEAAGASLSWPVTTVRSKDTERSLWWWCRLDKAWLKSLIEVESWWILWLSNESELAESTSPKDKLLSALVWSLTTASKIAPGLSSSTFNCSAKDRPISVQVNKAWMVSSGEIPNLLAMVDNRDWKKEGMTIALVEAELDDWFIIFDLSGLVWWEIKGSSSMGLCLSLWGLDGGGI